MSPSDIAVSSVKVGLLQFEVSSNKEQNHVRAKEYLTRAAEQGVQLAVLPEIWNGPYATAAFGDYAEVLPNVGDGLDSSSTTDDATTTSSSSASSSARLLQTLAKELQLWIVGGSISERCDDEKLYNTCLVINPQGTIVAKHRKVHLFDIHVPGGICFQESDTLSAGNTLSWFDSPFGRIGLGICYDIRFPEYALALARLTQASTTTNNETTTTWHHSLTMLIYPGAFNLTTGPAHWELLQRARALDNQCYCLTASPARVTPEAAAASATSASTSSPITYPHYTAWGHSTMVGPWGDVIATCDEGPALVVAELDLTKVPQIRQQIPILQQKRYDLYTPVDAVTSTINENTKKKRRKEL
jgi:omega-amidase